MQVQIPWKYVQPFVKIIHVIIITHPLNALRFLEAGDYDIKTRLDVLRLKLTSTNILNYLNRIRRLNIFMPVF